MDTPQLPGSGVLPCARILYSFTRHPLVTLTTAGYCEQMCRQLDSDADSMRLFGWDIEQVATGDGGNAYRLGARTPVATLERLLDTPAGRRWSKRVREGEADYLAEIAEICAQARRPFKHSPDHPPGARCSSGAIGF